MPSRRKLRSVARSVVLVAFTLAATALISRFFPSAEAAVVVEFEEVFSTNDNGAIIIVGNNLLTCRTNDVVDGQTCPSVRAATASSDLNNNSWFMAHIDADGAAFPTFNSSSALAEFPSGDSVLWAGLYWGARLRAGTGGAHVTGAFDQMSLRGPGDTAYRTIQSDQQFGPTTTADRLYQQFAEVTEIVQGLGPGTYWGANVPAATGVDRHAGWALVVVYQDPTLPLRNLTVFDGLADVGRDEPTIVGLTGFLAPLDGTVDTQLGMVAYEGDTGSAGDEAFLEGTRLATALSLGNNFFNSTNDRNGELVTTRNPSHRNMLGFEVKTLGAPDVIDNGATSATFEFSSTAERYVPGVLTTTINLYSPDFTPSTKNVVNLTGNSPARPADILEYTLTYVNAGQDPATDVVASDPLPTGVTFVPGSLSVVSGDDPGVKTDGAGDDEAEYLAASRTVVFRLGSGANATSGGTIAPNGGTTVVRFQVSVNDVGAVTTLDNRAELAYVADTIGDQFTYLGNHVETVVEPVADLSVVKSTASNPVVAGTDFTSTITVTNEGPNTAEQVTAVDALPAGTVLVSATASQGSCSTAGTTATCALGTLLDGASATITVTGHVPAAATVTSFTNTASVTSGATDPDLNNNSSQSTTGVLRSADVSVSKTALGGPIVPGTIVTFQITVSNAGPSDAVDLAIDDTLGSGLTIVSTAAPPGFICTPRTGGFRCTAARMTPGQTLTGTFDALVAPGFTGVAVANAVSVLTGTPDPDTANNSSNATGPVAPPQSNLEIIKTADVPSLEAGGQVTFTLAYRNLGPSHATGVTIQDALPAGLNAVTATSNRGTCSLGPPVTCTVGTLVPQAGGTVTIVATAPGDVTGTLSNTATIASPITADPTPGNNSSTTEVEVVGKADLSVSKVGTPNPVLAGDQVTYTVNVDNAGPSTAEAVNVVDTLPAGFTFVAGSAAPSQGTCGPPAGGALGCDLGDIAAGGSATVTFVMGVPTGFVGSATNQVDVISETVDPVPDNNAAEALSSTDSTADISVSKSSNVDPLIAGEAFTYTIEVANAGPSDAADLVISDTLPEGVTAVDQGSCTVDGQEVTCPIGTLAAGLSSVVELDATVASDVPNGTLLTNVARATSSTPDRDSSNNTAVLTNTVQASADLAITQTIGPPAGVEGTFTTFTMTIENLGPSTADDVSFVHVAEWPDTGLVGITFNGEGVPCEAAEERTIRCTLASNPDFLCRILITGEFECSFGDLEPDETMVLEMIVALVNAPPIGDYVNQASTASLTPDPILDNNLDVDTFTVTGYSSDLQITKTAPNELVAGAEFRYEMTWVNGGPSTAFDVLIEDTLHPDLVPTSVTTTNGTCDLAGQSFACEVGDTPWFFHTGFTGTVVVTGTVAPDATGIVDNTVTISSPISAEPDPSNNTAIATNTITQSADLSAFKTASAETAAGGGSITYTFGVINSGPSIAENVQFVESLPQGVLEFTLLDPRCQSGPGDDIVCDFGTLQPGEQGVATLSVTFADDFEGDAVNTVTASSTTPDPDSDDLVAEITIPVQRVADLTVTKTPVAPTAVAGGQLTYNVVLANNGPSSADEVILTDTIPDGTSVVEVVTEPAIDCDIGAAVITCPVGTMEPGTSQTLVVTVALSTSLEPGELINTAIAASPTADPNPPTRIAEAVVQVTVEADVEITKTTVTSPVLAGQPITYRFDVVNNGPSDAPDVLISDLLTEGTTFAGFTASQGSCEVEIDVDLEIASCALGDIPVGGSATATITLDTAPTLAGSLRNLAVVGSGGLDPLDLDNTAEVDDAIVIPSDLSVAKAGPAVVDAGGSGTYVITYANAGPGDATGVVVTETVPAGLVPTPPPGCSSAADTVSCDIGTVLVGASGTVEIPVTVAAGLPEGTRLTDVATISSDQIDPDPSDDRVEFTSTSRRALDAFVTVVADRDQTTPGGPAGYVVTVGNEGPIEATGTVVTITLSDELVIGRFASVGLTPLAFDSSLCTLSGTRMACSVGELAVGETSTLEIFGTASVNTTEGTTLVASAQVSVAEVDVQPTDNVGVDGILITSVVVGGPLPFTGAQIFGLAVIAIVLLGAGIVLAFTARPRTRAHD